MELKSLFDLSKLPTKFLFVFAVITGFVLFARGKTLSIVKLESIHEKYGEVIGVIFLVSAGIVFVNVFLWVIQRRRKKIYKSKFVKRMKSEIKKFSDDEKSVLREFIVPEVKTIIAPIDNPAVAGLIHRKVLTTVRPLGGKHQIMRQDKIGEYLYHTTISINKVVIDFITNEDVDYQRSISEEHAEFLNENRPHWVQDNMRWEFNFDDYIVPNPVPPPHFKITQTTSIPLKTKVPLFLEGLSQ